MELETFGILVAVAFSIWVLVGIFRDKGGIRGVIPGKQKY